MTQHACQTQTAHRAGIVLVIVAAVEIGVGQDGLACDFIEGDVLCGQLGGRCDDRSMADAFRVLQRPRQGLHATQAAADHRGKALDAEQVGEAGLGVYPVFDGDEGEGCAPRLAGGRIDRDGARGSVTAAEVVDADDEELARIERLARAHQIVPPANVVGRVGVAAGDVVRTGQCMAHQYRVAARGIEGTVGFVDQVVARQYAAAAQWQRRGEMRCLWRHDADRLRLDHGCRLQKTKNPAGCKNADWVALALAGFIERPQAMDQIGAMA
ncbi:hypothetical protein SDC9_161953 [bioreactor metagenome]|uniref:Uncharacterized protein n=1 Tax=bioreactor metagenome TaxID=1076179 RepID=A0A645FLU0_9ZZZZ